MKNIDDIQRNHIKYSIFKAIEEIGIDNIQVINDIKYNEKTKKIELDVILKSIASVLGG